MRTLDASGLGPVSRIGLGARQFGSREWGYGADHADRAAGDTVRRARQLGISPFDTAEAYGYGRSERILGGALGEERDRVVVAIKIWPLLPVRPVVRRRLEASAGRLGLRRIPLYQVHQSNPVVPDRVIMPVFRQLLDEGRGAPASPTTRWADGGRPTWRSAGRC